MAFASLQERKRKKEEEMSCQFIMSIHEELFCDSLDGSYRSARWVGVRPSVFPVFFPAFFSAPLALDCSRAKPRAMLLLWEDQRLSSGFDKQYRPCFTFFVSLARSVS